MNKINGSILIPLFFLLILIASFINQYEHFFFTRLLALAFGVIYLVMEIKKDFFSANKFLFLLISVLFMIGFGAVSWMDTVASTGSIGSEVFVILLSVFTLISLSYKDLYPKNEEPA